MRLSAENLSGRTIVDADGHVIGEVTTIFLDSSTWRVESFLAKLRREIADQVGANRTIFHAGTVEIPVNMVQSVGDAVLLTVAGDELRRVVSGDRPGEAAAGGARAS